MTQLPLALLLFGATVLAAPEALAQSAAEKGRAIAERGSERVEGYGDFVARGLMILANAQGATSERRFDFAALEVENDGDQSLFVFEWPGDIEGTALLTHAHTEDDDDQWLFLPALKRVKRISSSNRSSSFVGSEFAYEDLVPVEIAKYSYLWLEEEPCPNDPTLDCHVVERRADDAHSGYTRQVFWRDQDAYRIQQVDHYDRKDSLLKTLTVTGYQLYEERFWRPDEMLMRNHQNGKSTTMSWSDYRFDTGLDARDFTTRALERSR